MKILIPTCRKRDSGLITNLIANITEHSTQHEVYASCVDASAAVNRNLCLDQINVGDVAIMIDDDVSGFYPGWVNDLLIGLDAPDAHGNAVMVSARLLNADGSFGPTCSERFEPEPMELIVPVRSQCVMPTAAICFIHAGHRFNENFRGSGFEDNDWMGKYVAAWPQCRFVQSNRCKLYHANHMLNQKGANWEHNSRLFRELWPNGLPHAQ